MSKIPQEAINLRLYNGTVCMADGGDIRMTAAEEVLAWLLIEKIGVPDDVAYSPNQAKELIVQRLAQAKELEEIDAMLDEGQGDDEGPQILPDFTPNCSTYGKVEACLHILERRRDVIESFIADVAREQGAGVAVKRLEWNVTHYDQADIWEARTVLGRYHFEDDRFAEPAFILCLHQLVIGRYSSPESAKAAAQADYEQRIRSALTTPPAPQPPVKLDGPELWEIVFRVLKGDVPDQLTDEAFAQIAKDISECGFVPAPQPTEREKVLEEVIREAIDLLMCRKLGSHARSPEHNARLKLQAALAGEAPSQTDRAEGVE